MVQVLDGGRNMTQRDSDDAGYDSFLDVVSNMVGILIVLVMVVGIRAGNAPLPSLPPEPPKPTETPSSSLALHPVPPPLPELQQLATLTEESERINTELITQEEVITNKRRQIEERQLAVSQAAHQEEQRRQQAIQLADLTVQREQTSATRAELTRSQQEHTQLQRTLYGLRIERKELESQLAQSSPAQSDSPTPQDSPESTEPSVVTLESYPTPVGRVVSGPELHYQLRGNRVIHVPIDALTRLVVEDARSQVHRLSDRLVTLDHFNSGDNRAMGELGATVGPVEGFRMRYLLRRVARTVQGPNGPAQERGVELAGWTILPVSGVQGETMDEIFQSNSAFLRSLNGVTPQGCTLTFWISGDSFESFHTIRKWAHEQGWSVAGRPLPEGFPISGSPDGARTESI